MRRLWPMALALGAVCLVTAFSSSSAAAPRKCKGTKIWYANDCRYPDEVERMKAQQAKRQQAEAQQRAADTQACREARTAGTADGWRAYLNAHPEGGCREEAAMRIRELESQPEPSTPAPEPAPPEPAPPPQNPPPEPLVPPAAEPDGEGISPWAWVGFGVGGAALLTWGITGGVSMSMSSDITGDCPSDVCPREREDDIDTAKALAHVATTGFVVGLAGCAFGVIVLVATAGSEGDASTAAAGERPSIAVRPLVGPGYLGVSGSF